MTDNPQRPPYKPGDVVNGHRLGDDNVWHPIGQHAPQARAHAAPAAAKRPNPVVGWVSRNKPLAALLGLALLFGFIGAVASGDDESSATAVAATESAEPTATEEATPQVTETPFKMPSKQKMSAALDKVWKPAMLDDQSATETQLITVLMSKFGGEESDYSDYATIYYDAKQAEKEYKDSVAAAEKLANAVNDAKTPSTRTWAKIVKNPDAYADKYYVIYGEITQFDAATGTDTFRANIATSNTTSYGYFDGENCILVGSEKRLSDFVTGDVFRATIRVDSAFSYDTQIGGSTTVPLLEVVKIKRIGHND